MANGFKLVERPDLKSSLTEVLRTPNQLRDTDQITIAQYNVYNLFGQYAKKPKSRVEREALAKVILDLGPDVIAFEEVQAEAVLKAFFQRLVNPGLADADKYDGFVCIPANDVRGINVALVTRLSVRGVMTFHDREIETGEARNEKFSRDLLGVQIQMTPNPADTYIHFACHLKSQIGGEPAAIKRGMEATEIVSIFTDGAFGQNPFLTQPCILSGDFNDQPDSPAVQIISTAGLSDTFSAVNPNYTYPTNINSRKSAKRYSPQRLDYMFATPSMVPRLSDLSIYREEPTDDASDHYPLTAVMRV